jgi:hypothetical protein
MRSASPPASCRAGSKVSRRAEAQDLLTPSNAGAEILEEAIVEPRGRAREEVFVLTTYSADFPAFAASGHR